MTDPAETSAADDAALLLQYLHGRDSDCPACGYNLRDLREPRCPECGDALRLSVSAAERHIALPIAGLIPLSGVTCLNLVVVVFFLYNVARYPRQTSSHDWNIFWFYFALPLAVFIGALVFWIRGWRRLGKTRDARRWLLVLLAWALPIAQLVVVINWLQ